MSRLTSSRLAGKSVRNKNPFRQRLSCSGGTHARSQSGKIFLSFRCESTAGRLLLTPLYCNRVVCRLPFFSRNFHRAGFAGGSRSTIAAFCATFRSLFAKLQQKSFFVFIC